MRILARAIGILCVLGVALAVWIRPLVDGPPHFTIQHEIEIAGSREEVWGIFTDSSRYAEWNPYLLRMDGELVAGRDIEIEIAQDTWDEPMVLTVAVVEATPPSVLHWRGELRPKGLMQTDHSFRIEARGEGRVRFVQREEFRGKIAEFFDDAIKGDTERAFRAMDEALARRVASLRAERAR